MIRLPDGTMINPRHVADLSWDRRFYANGSASWLVIRMSSGVTYRVESDYLVDAHAIERQIVSALLEDRA
ncbi:hypothetical protein [Devosia sp. DBB001]|nr:hypothetical protein [Devosia sp. DBB001]